MSTHTKLLLVSLLAGTMIVSIVGGGLLGGAAGYYLAQHPVGASATAITTTATQAQPVSSQPGSNNTIAAIQSVAPAVVTVINTLDPQKSPNNVQILPSPFGQLQPAPNQAAKASGSGVIIDKKGYIVTNNHVIENAQSLEVIYADGSRHTATLVGADPVSDLAVIQVKDAVPAVASLGDSTQLQPGETVVAIGSPLGDFKNSVTEGIVSATNRNVDQQEGLIQTDAAINPGNSGGPLVDTQGNVIGLNTLVVRGDGTSAQAEGLGFAIPSATIQSITQQLIAKGKVERPYLGVQYTLLDPDVAAQLQVTQTTGAYISDVTSNGPAAQAGLRKGDIITAIDSTNVDSSHTLSSLVMAHHIGDTVSLTVQRDGKAQTFSIKLGTRPSDIQS